MKYLPIHSSSSIWLRYDNLWTNLNQFVCKHYGTYRVYYAYLIVWTFLYLWIYLFFFFSPDLCCVPRLYIALFSVAIVAIGLVGAHWRIWGSIFIALIWHKFYCTIPRQFTLHLHRYNILRSPRGTQFWVSRSKKMSRQGVAIFGLLGTP